MVEKPEYRLLIQPVTGLPEAKQLELLAHLQPAEHYVCRTAEEFESFIKHLRPPRVVGVAYAGLLGEQRGNKLDRVDNMAATKAGIHRRGSYVVEAGGRDSRKQWAAMRRDGENMCRRLAQGRRSALNGRKGAEPYEFADKHLSRFALIMAKGKNDADRLAKIRAYCKAQKLEAPKRTWLYTKLPQLMRERGLG
jgi:hypothetical protein